MKVRHYYPVTLTVDGEEIILRIKRMTLEEHSEFSIRFGKVGTPTYMRFFSRASSGPEQERDDKGEYTIRFEKLAERRLEQMSAEERAEYDAAARADEAEAKGFLVWTCEQFVTVERGLIEELPDGTERSISAGVDFIRIFGARQDVLQQTLAAVRMENEMDAQQKKAWRSRTGFSPSSNGRRRGRAGRKPKTVAKPVAIEAYVSNEDVKNSQADGPSGSMGTLPSGLVPSLQ